MDNFKKLGRIDIVAFNDVEVVRKAIQDKSLTIPMLANEIGISVMTIHRAITPGQTISIKSFNTICDYLHLDRDALKG